MIFGIGTDIVEIERMQALIDKHDDKIVHRILTEAELVAFEQSASPAAFLAKRFAAKEAAAKAFGTGFRDGLSLQHISVINDALGRPELHFSDRALALIAELNIGSCFLSLSDEQHYALASVIMEKNK